MFIAMNRFQVRKERASDFERVWKERDSHLAGVSGFMTFHLLRGPEHEDHVLYSSHTTWRSKAAFEAWTQSEAFRKAHQDAGGLSGMYLDRPHFEGFEVLQSID